MDDPYDEGGSADVGNDDASASSSSSDEGGRDDDIDAFLVSVMSKLKSPFTSLELCKSIQSSADGRGGSSMTPRRHVRLIHKAFDQMTKHVKMRVLVSLLCLDPFALVSASSSNNDDDDDEAARRARANRVERSVLRVLEKAENDDDEWVRILAGTVKGKIYHLPKEDDGESPGDGDDDDDDHDSCRGAAAEKLLEKSCARVLKEVQNRAVAAYERAERLYDERDDDDDDDDDDDLLTALVDHTVSDTEPLFVPYRYSLLDVRVLRKILPDAVNNDHFRVADWEVPILCVDAEEEKLKAEEESREIEKKRSLEARARKLQEQKEQKEKQQKEKESSLRPPPLSSTSAGRGGVGKTAASGRGRENFPGRIGMPGRGGRMFGRGSMGRGAAAGSSSFMRAPTRPKNMPGRNLGRTPNGVRTSAIGGNRAKKNARASKVSLIDASDVDDWRNNGTNNGDNDVVNDLPRTDDESRAAKRRRILEQFNSRKQRPANNGGRGPGRPQQQAPKQQTQRQPQQQQQQQRPAAEPSSVEEMHANYGHQQQQRQETNDNHNGNGNGNAAAPNPTEQILSKSNKISPQDRYRVEQFFSSHYNPTPEVSVYKMKLNEEKKQQPTENGNLGWVKETLYLELDYTTLKYKMSRKSKSYN